jgi:hypothetical protein
MNNFIGVKTSKEVKEKAKKLSIAFLQRKSDYITIKDSNIVFKQVEKIPIYIIDFVHASLSKRTYSGCIVDVIKGDKGVTTHPLMKYLRYSPVDKGESKKTWDKIPGAGSRENEYPLTVVEVSALTRKGVSGGTGCHNLILHEYGHTFDISFSSRPKSSSKKWKLIWENDKKVFEEGSYYYEFSEEYFAYSFEQFYNSSFSKKYLADRSRSFLQELDDKIRKGRINVK